MLIYKVLHTQLYCLVHQNWVFLVRIRHSFLSNDESKVKYWWKIYFLRFIYFFFFSCFWLSIQNCIKAKSSSSSGVNAALCVTCQQDEDRSSLVNYKIFKQFNHTQWNQRLWWAERIFLKSGSKVFLNLWDSLYLQSKVKPLN